MREKTYTTFEVAEICGVYPSTVINWVKRGQLDAYTTPGGHRRILESVLAEFLKKYKFPIPESVAVGRRRVVIVEDDDAVGQMLVKALRRASPELDVRWIKDGVEAMLFLGKDPPDMMILDVVTPVIDGARVLATLRSDPNTSRMRVIGMTGKRLPPDKLKYMQKHTDAFFLKPFDIKAFTEKALALLRSGVAGTKTAKA